jgi:hypothetical protein
MYVLTDAGHCGGDERPPMFKSTTKTLALTVRATGERESATRIKTASELVLAMLENDVCDVATAVSLKASQAASDARVAAWAVAS